MTEALLHRIRGHEAALRMASLLGWPDALALSVAETRVRLDECHKVLAAHIHQQQRQEQPA